MNRKCLNEKAFAAYLSEILGYTPKMTERTLKSVKAMDSQVLEWFVDWMETGLYPQTPVEGVTARELLEKAELGLNPVSVFLTLDFLKKDPAGAKYILTQRAEKRDMDEKKMEILYEQIKNRMKI